MEPDLPSLPHRHSSSPILASDSTDLLAYNRPGMTSIALGDFSKLQILRPTYLHLDSEANSKQAVKGDSGVGGAHSPAGSSSDEAAKHTQAAKLGNFSKLFDRIRSTTPSTRRNIPDSMSSPMFQKGRLSDGGCVKSWEYQTHEENKKTTDETLTKESHGSLKSYPRSVLEKRSNGTSTKPQSQAQAHPYIRKRGPTEREPGWSDDWMLTLLSDDSAIPQPTEGVPETLPEESSGQECNSHAFTDPDTEPTRSQVLQSVEDKSDHEVTPMLPSPLPYDLLLADHIEDSAPDLIPILSYIPATGGPVRYIYGQIRSTAEKHESLAFKLIQHLAADRLLAKETPKAASNGVHVFLDMSNINISFLNALRAKHGLPEDTRFKPLPQLNLGFLTEVLVRYRRTCAMNSGCSVRPGHRTPPFVTQLERLGYRVDLRSRKRVEGSKQGLAPSSSSDDLLGSGTTGRFVEDLVDETLQTRIGESVMKYFEEQGTIILATGDAKPAQYSDGFRTYAERALRMGWNVEVISWKSSMSFSWRNPTWTSKWGDRFRIIELDDFLDELLMNL